MPPTSAHAALRGSTDAADALRAGDEGGRKRPWLHATRLIVGLLLLAAVLVIVARFADARRLAEMMRRAQPTWLLLGAVLQAATYICAGGIWWLVLRRTASPQPLRALVLLSMGKLFTDQALPSGGVTGSALMIRGVVRRGTPAPAASAALIIGLLGFYAAMIVATAASLLVLWIHHGARPVLVVMTAMLLAIAATVSTCLIVLVRGDGSAVRRWLARIRPLRKLLDSLARVPHDAIRDRASLSGSFGLQLANIVLDAATLLVMLTAVGEHVAPRSVFASFVFASVAEMTGVAPGGLGTFESTCVALLHLSGVDLEPALAGTLLLRGFTFWLPMIPGVAIVRRELGRK
jgi:glycosyltransferase 2 family protein